MARKQVKPYLPVDLLEEVEKTVDAVPGLNATNVYTMAIERYLTEAEAEAWSAHRWDGSLVEKAAGAPFPPREGRIRTGSPKGSEGGETKQTSFLIDEELDDRFRNALFWLDDYASHVIITYARRLLEERRARLAGEG